MKPTSKRNLFVSSLNTVCAFRIPHTPSQTAFPQGLCFITSIPESFWNPSARADCCTAPRAKMADAYAWWNRISRIHSASLYFLLPFHSSPPTLFYNRHGFLLHKEGPLFLVFIKSTSPMTVHRLLLCHLHPFFPHICLLTLFVPIHTGKGKIPSAHAYLYLLRRLSPNAPSSNIRPAVKRSGVATRGRAASRVSHAEEWKRALKREPRTFFWNKNCEEGYLQGFLSSDPGSPWMGSLFVCTSGF